MPVSVSDQAIIFFYSGLGGMLIAFLYDAFRIKRKAMKTGTFSLYVEDIVYWVIVAIIMFGTIYISNDGELRGFIFLGTFIGIIIYILFLSKIVMMILITLLRIIHKVFTMVWKVATYPFRVIFKILSIPGLLILSRIKRISKRIKVTSKSRLSKAAIHRRIFKNVRKKI